MIERVDGGFAAALPLIQLAMFDFLRKRTRSTGSVLLRGAIPPRLENFYFLKDVGVELTPEPAGEESVWAARARLWGQASQSKHSDSSRLLEYYLPRETKSISAHAGYEATSLSE